MADLDGGMAELRIPGVRADDGAEPGRCRRPGCGRELPVKRLKPWTRRGFCSRHCAEADADGGE